MGVEAIAQSGHLLRILGLGFGVAAVVGSVIGQGILRSPGVVAQATGSPILILGLWLAGGVIAVLAAFVFVELAAAIPHAGGLFAHIHRAFGRRIGLVAALALLFAGLSTVAMLSFVTGEFMVRLGVGAGALSAVHLGIAVTALFAVLNASGTRTSGASQVVLSSLKGAVLIALIVALFGASVGVPPAPPTTDPAWLRAGWLPLGTAMLVIISTYNGWWDLAFYGEEIDDPGRQIPRAMIGGILGVSAIYLLLNMAMLRVMTPDEMAGSNFVAADAAGTVFGARTDYLLTLFGVLSVGAIGNLQVMTTTRFVFALSRAQVLPKPLSIVASNGTPIWAMLFTAATGAVFILTGSYTALSSMSVSMMQGVVVLTLLAAIALRRKEPELHRPFRIPFYPWPVVASLLIAAILLVIFIVQDPWYALSGFALVAVGWVLIEFVFERKPILEAIDLQSEQ